MAAITIISGRYLLNTYESSVLEMRLEMAPIEQLQKSLREADNLVLRYAIERDQSAPMRFNEVEAEVNTQLQILAEIEAQFALLNDSHHELFVPEIRRMWQDEKAMVLAVFEYSPGSPEATRSLARVLTATGPARNALSEFHSLSIHEMQERLSYAQSVGKRAFLTMFGAILAALALLIVLGIAVGRSVLQPIAELQLAAGKLGKKEFSHRVRLRNTRDELGQLGKAFNHAANALQRLYQELERRSTHDGLTGLLNRAGFDARLSAEWKSADRHQRPLALLIVDIDFFKSVNDKHGHQAGDRVLQAVARLFGETTRPGDIVARYGGEEFAIILVDADEDSAMALAERVRTAVENACVCVETDEDIRVTVSIGCASRRQHMLLPADLVRSADIALYRAKDAGRNRIVSAGKPASANGTDAQTDEALL